MMITPKCKKHLLYDAHFIYLNTNATNQMICSECQSQQNISNQEILPLKQIYESNDNCLPNFPLFISSDLKSKVEKIQKAVPKTDNSIRDFFKSLRDEVNSILQKFEEKSVHFYSKLIQQENKICQICSEVNQIDILKNIFTQKKQSDIDKQIKTFISDQWDKSNQNNNKIQSEIQLVEEINFLLYEENLKEFSSQIISALNQLKWLKNTNSSVQSTILQQASENPQVSAQNLQGSSHNSKLLFYQEQNQKSLLQKQEISKDITNQETSKSQKKQIRSSSVYYNAKDSIQSPQQFISQIKSGSQMPSKLGFDGLSINYKSSSKGYESQLKDESQNLDNQQLQQELTNQNKNMNNVQINKSIIKNNSDALPLEQQQINQESESNKIQNYQHPIQNIYAKYIQNFTSEKDFLIYNSENNVAIDIYDIKKNILHTWHANFKKNQLFNFRTTSKNVDSVMGYFESKAFKGFYLSVQGNNLCLSNNKENSLSLIQFSPDGFAQIRFKEKDWLILNTEQVTTKDKQESKFKLENSKNSSIFNWAFLEKDQGTLKNKRVYIQMLLNNKQYRVNSLTGSRFAEIEPIDIYKAEIYEFKAKIFAEGVYTFQQKSGNQCLSTTNQAILFLPFTNKLSEWNLINNIISNHQYLMSLESFSFASFKGRTILQLENANIKSEFQQFQIIKADELDENDSEQPESQNNECESEIKEEEIEVNEKAISQKPHTPIIQTANSRLRKSHQLLDSKTAQQKDEQLKQESKISSLQIPKPPTYTGSKNNPILPPKNNSSQIHKNQGEQYSLFGENQAKASSISNMGNSFLNKSSLNQNQFEKINQSVNIQKNGKPTARSTSAFQSRDSSNPQGFSSQIQNSGFSSNIKKLESPFCLNPHFNKK